MGILLMDTTAKTSEFGYAENGELIFSLQTDPGVNADKLTYYMKSAFEKYGLKFSEIEYLSLSNGPGSFTGLRIGSAIAKGICFVTGCKLIEIPTLDLIANKFSSSGKVTSMIFSNTRNSEFYYCKYDKQPEEMNRISDYQKGSPEEIFTDINVDYVINGTDLNTLPEKYRKMLSDVSEFSTTESQLKLTLKEISLSNFSDHKTSQPFYMNEFIPKI